MAFFQLEVTEVSFPVCWTYFFPVLQFYLISFPSLSRNGLFYIDPYNIGCILESNT